MKACLVNYNYTPTWLLESGLDYLIYDRSDSKEWLKDFPQERVIYTENIGQVDYDKLTYLIDNYYNLPDVFLWGKTNIHKYVDNLDESLKKGEYAPLLRQDHKTYRDDKGVVCFYQDEMYQERNDSWFYWSLPSITRNYDHFAAEMNIPSPPYIAFNPGGNFILTSERVRRYGPDFYKKLRDSLPHAVNPAEAHACERSYATIWR